MSELLETYKEVMSHWPSGVTIVTSEFEGKRYGMTVSSFTSVSLHPAMVSICVDKHTQMCTLLQKSQKMAVNILDSTQKELGMAFADHDLEMPERFELASFENKTTDSPVLGECVGWLDCNIHSFHDIGDHVIFVGQVKQAKQIGNNGPVIYYRRSWKHLSTNL